MSVVRNRKIPGFYCDSVRLMLLQRELAALPGIEDAGAVMGSAVNLSLLADAGLLPEGGSPSATDLLICVRAKDEASGREALQQVERLLESGERTSGGYQPRSLQAALQMLPECNLVSISIPGRFAADLAEKALELKRHVFLFSDNVSLEDEVRLKREADRQGLLLMGPDCGTALIHGVGLGFCNQVKAGPIGLVSASGTGLQAVASALDESGSGVSLAFGCGSRDLSDEVGGLTTIQALQRLEEDRATGAIVLISKPPSPRTAARILDTARSLSKPVVVDFLGQAPPAERIDNLYFVSTFSEAARQAAQLPEDRTERSAVDSAGFASGQKLLRGFFSGGTLAQEALQILKIYSPDVQSNLSGSTREEQAPGAHWVLDLGADEFTSGRLHPMLDHRLRIERLLRSAKNPQVAVVVLDVVLGHGAHPDPASELAPAIQETRRVAAADGRRLETVVLLVGTEADPQDLEKQRSEFGRAGAIVESDCRSAISHAGGLISALNRRQPAETDVNLLPLDSPLQVVNIGLEAFYQSMIAQDVESLHVDWRPPAGGDEELASILSKMK